MYPLSRRAFLASAPVAVERVLKGAGEDLSVATFHFNVTPPLGAPLCLGGVKAAAEIVDRLSARGIILFAAGQAPIVLCAVDWVAISNEGHDEWRQKLGAAAGTPADRVVVHCLHQHDAPGYDPSAEKLLAAAGLPGRVYDVAHAREVLEQGAAAVRNCLTRRQPVSHIALGKGRVERVASTRRVLGPDGKVKYVRYSATPDPVARAQPEGVIDPDVRLVSFWNGDRPLASLTYYGTHPQSYYGQGGVSADFVGMARSLREAALPGTAQVHFDRAGGNVTAGAGPAVGKWNEAGLGRGCQGADSFRRRRVAYGCCRASAPWPGR